MKTCRYLASQAGHLERAVADAVRSGDFNGAADGFGNKPWAADWHLVKTLDGLVRSLGKPKVIETGSGLSTMVMLAAGADLASLEQDVMWGQYTTRFLDKGGFSSTGLRYAPLADNGSGVWYDAHDQSADMIFIDGPRRDEPGMRARICDYMPEALRSAKIVVVDDTDDLDGRKLIERLNRAFGFKFDLIHGPRRQYAVGMAQGCEDIVDAAICPVGRETDAQPSCTAESAA